MQTAILRDVLVFVAGSTPQIITETIYALASQQPQVIAAEVHIITTTLGRSRITETLLTRGILEELAGDCGIPSIPLTKDSFHIICDEHGEELADIRSAADNERAGDLIASLLQRLTEDKATRIHCSLAGGRKTMSFYMGSAFQLFAREWDRLYHVLVSPEQFEGHPDFYYKPRQNRTITTERNGITTVLQTDDADIQLAELPSLRMRHSMNLQGKGFRELVSAWQKELDTASLQPRLQVDLTDRTVQVGDKSIELVPSQLMLYATFLRQKTDHCRYRERTYCHDCAGCYLTFGEMSDHRAAEAMADDYARIYNGKPLKREEFLTKWKDGLSIEVIRQQVSKINKTIREQLDDATLAPYFILSVNKRYGGSRYGVKIERDKIFFVGESQNEESETDA